MAASIYCDRIESPLRDEIQSRDGLLTLVAIRYLLNAMRERLLVVPRPAVRTLTAAVDVVLLTPRDRTLAVLLLRGGAPESLAVKGAYLEVLADAAEEAALESGRPSEGLFSATTNCLAKLGQAAALGARAVAFHADAYGQMPDARNRGAPTDRLVAHCLLIESGGTLMLVDTGFGGGDCADPRRLGQPPLRHHLRHLVTAGRRRHETDRAAGDSQNHRFHHDRPRDGALDYWR